MQHDLRVVFSDQKMVVNADRLETAGVCLCGKLEFVLPTGVLAVVRGVNGVGKSTLLRQLAHACADLPESGAFLLKPDYGFRDEMLVIDQLNCMLPSCEPAELLFKAGLVDWQFEHVRSLSSGQRARLAIAVMMNTPAKLCLLDEPMNALDEEGLKLLANALMAHLKSGGVVVMAAHGSLEPLLEHAAGLVVQEFQMTSAGLTQKGSTSRLEPLDCAAPPAAKAIRYGIVSLLKRDLTLSRANPQTLLWAGLFHWMVLSFFGIGLLKTDVEVVRVLVLTCAMLSLLLGVKDWFQDDHRVGWLQHMQLLDAQALGIYWATRCILYGALQAFVLVPVTLLISLQFDLNQAQVMSLVMAMLLAMVSMTPLLGLLGILVMLTRGGAVLVYLLALPMLVPMLVFGLEVSQAQELGRSPWAPALLLLLVGLLGFMAGMPLSRRLFKLVQE